MNADNLPRLGLESVDSFNCEHGEGIYFVWNTAIRISSVLNKSRLSEFMNARRVIPLFSFTCKVIVAFMVHLLLFAIDGRTMQIEQYLPLQLGEGLCRLLYPGLIIDGETAYNVDMLDSWLFWGLPVLLLCFFLWGRNVTLGYLCLAIPLLATLIWTVTI